jgi:hypothetical protein
MLLPGGFGHDQRPPCTQFVVLQPQHAGQRIQRVYSDLSCPTFSVTL